MSQFDDQRPETDIEDLLEVGDETEADVAEETAGGEAPTAGTGAGQPDAASPELTEELSAEEELQSEADHLQGELTALHDRHLRLAAEFDNYRKRAQTEMSESWIRSQVDLVRRLLDPLDDIKRVSALDLSNATVEAIMEGIDLVERKMMRVLEEAGLEEIDPVGEPFDPNTMEAMMRVPANSAEDDDNVHEVFQKGYVLRGHLVRPARVSVLKHD